MKLIYLANIRIPTERAHGYAIMKMCEEFAAQGIDVELVVPNKKNIIGTDPFHYYNLKKNFQIKYLPTVDFLSKRLATGRLFFWIDYLLFWGAAFLSGSWRRADIIYTRDYILVGSSFGKKNILEIHDLPRKKRILLFVAKKAEKIIVITGGLKDDLIKAGIPADKILIAPDAADLEKFDIKISQTEAREKVSLPVEKKIIIYVGHLYGWKGADILADAAKLLPGYLIIFVGGVGAELADFKNKYGNCANIKMIPFQKRDALPFYLKAADILILPNKKGDIISEKYTSPLKLFEYMASGRPIVASDLPTMREVLNKNNAILVEPNSPEALACGVEAILKNKELAERLSDQSLIDVKNFSWQKRVEKIIKFIT